MPDTQPTTYPVEMTVGLAGFLFVAGFLTLLAMWRMMRPKKSHRGNPWAMSFAFVVLSCSSSLFADAVIENPYTGLPHAYVRIRKPNVALKGADSILYQSRDCERYTSGAVHAAYPKPPTEGFSPGTSEPDISFDVVLQDFGLYWQGSCTLGYWDEPGYLQYGVPPVSTMKGLVRVPKADGPVTVIIGAVELDVYWGGSGTYIYDIAGNRCLGWNTDYGYVTLSNIANVAGGGPGTTRPSTQPVATSQPTTIPSATLVKDTYEGLFGVENDETGEFSGGLFDAAKGLTIPVEYNWLATIPGGTPSVNPATDLKAIGAALNPSWIGINGYLGESPVAGWFNSANGFSGDIRTIFDRMLVAWVYLTTNFAFVFTWMRYIGTAWFSWNVVIDTLDFVCWALGMRDRGWLNFLHIGWPGVGHVDACDWFEGEEQDITSEIGEGVDEAYGMGMEAEEGSEEYERLDFPVPRDNVALSRAREDGHAAMELQADGRAMYDGHEDD